VSIVSAIAGLFSNDKAIDNVLDKDKGLLVRAGGWVDGLSYTKQEKAQMTMEFTKVANERLKALEPFKVVQRILAFGITGMWMTVGVNVVVAIWYDSVKGCTTAENTCFPVTGAMLSFAMSDYVFWPVVSVLSLYFLGGVLPKRTEQ